MNYLHVLPNLPTVCIICFHFKPLLTVLTVSRQRHHYQLPHVKYGRYKNTLSVGVCLILDHILCLQSFQGFDTVGWVAGTDLHMAPLIALPLTVSCSRKSGLVLIWPFWYRLTQVVLDKIQRAVMRWRSYVPAECIQWQHGVKSADGQCHQHCHHYHPATTCSSHTCDVSRQTVMSAPVRAAETGAQTADLPPDHCTAQHTYTPVHLYELLRQVHKQLIYLWTTAQHSTPVHLYTCTSCWDTMNSCLHTDCTNWKWQNSDGCTLW